jgi:hypothetical protein
VVREAAQALARPEVGIARGGYLGVTGRIELEETTDAPVPPQAYSAMLEEIRKSIGEAGRVNETFDRSFFWEGRLPSVSARKVQITVSPTGGRSKIRIVEHLGEDMAVAIASIVGGTALSVFAGVAVAASSDNLVAAALAGGAVWAGQYGAVRALYHRFVRKRFRNLQGLLKRLSRHTPSITPTSTPSPDRPW